MPLTLLTQPLPITLTCACLCLQVAGKGLAASTQQFQYVNLWSHSSTWGGSSPPVSGDSVYLPPNVTVMLDVSPPPLNTFIIDGGVLMFDPTAAQVRPLPSPALPLALCCRYCHCYCRYCPCRFYHLLLSLLPLSLLLLLPPLLLLPTA